MGMLAKIRRMHLRERLSIREISRKTVRDWLRQSRVVEPVYAKRTVITKRLLDMALRITFSPPILKLVKIASRPKQHWPTSTNIAATIH